MKISFLFFLFPLFATAQTWSALDDFPATERDDGVGFVIGDKAYCGTGLTPWWAELNDFYTFDLSNDSWSAIAPLSDGEERQYASAFTNGNEGFVFGGLAGGNYKNDLWQYNPEEDEWIPKTALPATGRSGSTSFVIGDIVYLIGGRNDTSNALDEVWAYDMTNDSWSQQDEFPFGGRWRASGITINGKGYLIFGRDENGYFRKNLVEYDPEEDDWSIVGTFPEFGRTHAAIQAFGDQLVFFGGIDSLQTAHNDYWRFSLTDLSWQELTPLPDNGRRGGISFVYNNVFYYTTGIDTENERLRETWKLDNPTSVVDFTNETEFQLFPNPASDFFTINLQANFSGPVYCTVYDSGGKVIRKMMHINSPAEIDASEWKPGIYFVHVSTDAGGGGMGVKKILLARATSAR